MRDGKGSFRLDVSCLLQTGSRFCVDVSQRWSDESQFLSVWVDSLWSGELLLHQRFGTLRVYFPWQWMTGYSSILLPLQWPTEQSYFNAVILCLFCGSERKQMYDSSLCAPWCFFISGPYLSLRLVWNSPSASIKVWWQIFCSVIFEF